MIALLLAAALQAETPAAQAAGAPPPAAATAPATPSAPSAPSTPSAATDAPAPGEQRQCRKGRSSTGSHMRATRCQSARAWQRDERALDAANANRVHTVASEHRGRKRGQ